MSSIPEPHPHHPIRAARRDAAWLIPTLIYVATLGGLGVTSKLALKHLDWQDLVLWLAIGHAVSVIALLTSGRATLRVVPGTGWVIVAAVTAITGLVAFYIALSSGQASKVVPISGAYPAVTLILSALFLRERLSVGRAVGVALVVIGVVIVTAS
jgi:bacterial/archaeal transporter family protein